MGLRTETRDGVQESGVRNRHVLDSRMDSFGCLCGCGCLVCRTENCS